MAKKNGLVRSVDDVGIGHKLKLSYFIASIIPIGVMTYLYLVYISPILEKEGRYTIGLVVAGMLVLTIVLSVLGLAMSNKAATESINTLKVLNVRMNSLLDLTKTFRESFYIDVLMDSIANSATQVLGAEASSILLYDQEGGLRFEYLTGTSSTVLKGRSVAPGMGITSWCAEEGKPVIINNVKKDARFSPHYDKETGFKTRSIICVPLIIEKDTIGVLEVLNKKDGGEFTEQDQKILFSLADHAALSIHRSKRYESSHSDFIHVTEILLAAMDHHLPAKRGHAHRVAKYSVKLAKAVGMKEEMQKELYFGALLHDIGFLKYDQEDYWGLKKFEMHPTIGYDMIKSISVWESMAPLVLSHHERYDGGGYPRGLAGKDIPPGARVLAVADAFDTMVSEKSYKDSIGFSQAVAELKNNAGTQFDPEVVEAFINAFDEKDISA